MATASPLATPVSKRQAAAFNAAPHESALRFWELWISAIPADLEALLLRSGVHALRRYHEYVGLSAPAPSCNGVALRQVLASFHASAGKERARAREFVDVFFRDTREEMEDTLARLPRSVLVGVALVVGVEPDRLPPCARSDADAAKVVAALEDYHAFLCSQEDQAWADASPGDEFPVPPVGAAAAAAGPAAVPGDSDIEISDVDHDSWQVEANRLAEEIFAREQEEAKKRARVRAERHAAFNQRVVDRVQALRAAAPPVDVSVPEVVIPPAATALAPHDQGVVRGAGSRPRFTFPAGLREVVPSLARLPEVVPPAAQPGADAVVVPGTIGHVTSVSAATPSVPNTAPRPKAVLLTAYTSAFDAKDVDTWVAYVSTRGHVGMDFLARELERTFRCGPSSPRRLQYELVLGLFQAAMQDHRGPSQLLPHVKAALTSLRVALAHDAGVDPVRVHRALRAPVAEDELDKAIEQANKKLAPAAPKDKEKGSKDKEAKRRCFICRGSGHLASACPQAKNRKQDE